MKTPLQTPPAPPVARQTFCAPASFPFVEVRTTLASTRPYAEHVHSAFSLGLILEGGTRFSLRGSLHEAQAGDMALIAPGMPHSCNPLEGKPRGYHMAYFEPIWFMRRICRPLGLLPAYAVATPVVRDAALFAEALAALRAFCDEKADAEELFVAFFTRLQTAHACLVAAPAAISDGGLTRRGVCPSPARLLRAFRSAEGLPERAPVTTLARKAGLRRESFSRAFRRAAGLPPEAWLHSLRLEKARALLRQGKSITEAALAVGYADQSHFHRMFVKFFSVTPGGYQRGRSHSFKTPR